MLRDPVVWLPAGLVGLIRWNDFQSSMFNFHAVERQWYREQACNEDMKRATHRKGRL